MALRLKLAVIGLSLGIILPVMAYELASYPQTPFKAAWENNFGSPVFPNEISSIVENNTFFWLGSYDQNITLPNEMVPFVLNAINVTDGHSAWKDNFTIINPGFEFYGTSGGVVNTMPHIYWSNGKLMLISYALGYGTGTHFSRFKNISLLILDFNPGDGQLLGSHIFNSTNLDPSSPLLVHGGQLLGFSTLEQGLVYYSNGKQTTTFLTSVYALNLTSWNYWNDKFYIQVGPSFSQILDAVSGDTLALVWQGILNGDGHMVNTTFMGFNISNGQHTWNYTSNGNFAGLWATGNEFYFLNSTGENFSMESIYSSTGKVSGSFSIGGQNISLVQDVFLIQNSGVYRGFSLQGKLLWTLGDSFSVPVTSTSSVFGISSGYALISNLGSHYHYFVVNISTGEIAWNRFYYPLAPFYGQYGIPAVPIASGCGYIFFSMVSPKGNLTILAVKAANIGLA